MPTLALVWGILAFAGFCVALIPCLGWMNWVTIPLGLIGVVIAVAAISGASSRGQSAGPAVAGLVLSSIAVVPEARGQGLGKAVTAALTRRLFEEGAVVHGGQPTDQ